MLTFTKVIGLCIYYISRASVVIPLAFLSGCFDSGSDGDAPASQATSTISTPQPPPPTPPPPGPPPPTPPPPTPPPPGVNHPPEISGTPPASVQVGQTYSFTPSASDADQDVLAFSVVNAPAWAQFSTVNGALWGAPGETDVGETSDITITISDGHESRSLAPFRIEIQALDGSPPPTNAPPTISGSPAASATVNRNYSFMPAAADPDGDALTFSISNRPSWATFSSSTGRLSGVPAAAHVATYSNIVISVSDGRMSASLPAFSIEVRAGAANRPPTISGAPPTSVTAGLAYTFRPSGSDPDGDTLAYTIQNRPPWASFDASTGRLFGTPLATDAGSFANIVISVSDGSASASLPSFAITVRQPSTGSAALTWVAPTQNTDGSALADLAGFRIRYGTSASALNQLIEIPTPGVAAYVVANLDSGTWYFAVEAYNELGLASSPSSVASKTIQ